MDDGERRKLPAEGTEDEEGAGEAGDGIDEGEEGSTDDGSSNSGKTTRPEGELPLPGDVEVDLLALVVFHAI